MAIEAHRLSHLGVVGYASRRRVATVAAIVRGNGGAGVGSECRRKPARPRGLQYSWSRFCVPRCTHLRGLSDC